MLATRVPLEIAVEDIFMEYVLEVALVIEGFMVEADIFIEGLMAGVDIIIEGFIVEDDTAIEDVMEICAKPPLARRRTGAVIVWNNIADGREGGR